MSSISPLSASQPLTALEKSAADERKIGDSCREFEGVLWRQMLEKSMKPLLAQPNGGADKTGTYDYFLSNTLSEAVSGGPNSFAAMLEAQLSPQAPHTPPRGIARH